MKSLIAKLEMHLEMYENNAPIQKAEGRKAEAKESLKNAAAIRTALSILNG